MMVAVGDTRPCSARNCVRPGSWAGLGAAGWAGGGATGKGAMAMPGAPEPAETTPPPEAVFAWTKTIARRQNK